VILRLDRDAGIRINELESLEEDFRYLNQSLWEMGYKLIRSRYSWY